MWEARSKKAAKRLARMTPFVSVYWEGRSQIFLLRLAPCSPGMMFGAAVKVVLVLPVVDGSTVTSWM